MHWYFWIKALHYPSLASSLADEEVVTAGATTFELADSNAESSASHAFVSRLITLVNLFLWREASFWTWWFWWLWCCWWLWWLICCWCNCCGSSSWWDFSVLIEVTNELDDKRDEFDDEYVDEDEDEHEEEPQSMSSIDLVLFLLPVPLLVLLLLLFVLAMVVVLVCGTVMTDVCCCSGFFLCKKNKKV